MRAGDNRFAEICEIWMWHDLCDGELALVAASTDEPAGKRALPCLRAVISLSLMLCVLCRILAHQSSSVDMMRDNALFREAPG
jgi:hypothetical protein